MNTIRLVIELCLMRGRTQDFPTGMRYVWFTGVTSAVIDLFSLPAAEMEIGHVLFIASQVMLFGAAMWAMLKLRGVPERWMQTVTALYAANVVFSLLLLPFVPALSELVRQGANGVPGWEAYASLVLSVWFLAVMARVVREATDWPLGLSLLATFTCVAFVRIVGVVLAPAFGLQVGV
ncbi:MAG: hypothetical protein OEV31_00640 [Gammaproteobacteria bacterium]|nr:hypothetical protein [Gammaproteobacteria bacterium]